jgi:hypothetical protein
MGGGGYRKQLKVLSEILEALPPPPPILTEYFLKIISMNIQQVLFEKTAIFSYFWTSELLEDVPLFSRQSHEYSQKHGAFSCLLTPIREGGVQKFQDIFKTSHIFPISPPLLRLWLLNEIWAWSEELSSPKSVLSPRGKENPPFNSWKYFYHCRYKHSLFV